VTTTTGTDVIEHLDFHHAWPCEGQGCEAVATQLLKLRCPGCAARADITLCGPHWIAFQMILDVPVNCPECGTGHSWRIALIERRCIR